MTQWGDETGLVTLPADLLHTWSSRPTNKLGSTTAGAGEVPRDASAPSVETAESEILATEYR
jgi:hypothetical protein